MKNPGLISVSSLFFWERRVWSPVILLVSLLAMAWMSWGKWPDLVVDFGDQIYIAWRLSEGEVLYRDIDYFMGPLSSYIHGFLFKLFGVSFLVLAEFNFFLVVGLAALIYHLFTFVGNRLSGTLSALAFITIFAFAQYLWIGNHNFIVSYVYDLTHGVFLCFLSIYLFKEFVLRGTALQSASLGAVTGLIFLTKFEVFLAWVVSLTLGFLLIFYFSQPHRKNISKHLWAFLSGVALPPGAFLFYFSFHMPIQDALEAMIAPWIYIFGSPSISLLFYQNVIGLGALSANLKLMAYYIFVWAIIFAAIVFASRLSRKYFNNSIWANLLLLCLVPGALVFFQREIPWLDVLRPLPVILVLFGIYLCVTREKYFESPAQLAKGIVLFTVTVFSLVLLAKIFFNVHVYHYGVVLAMPATLVLIHILFFEAPRLISKTLTGQMFYTSSALILFLIFTYSHLRVSSDFYMKKNFPVGKGSDMIVGYNPSITPRSFMFQIALDVLEEEVQADEGIATFPMGALLNYMSRRVNPISTLSFNPVSKRIGEETVLKSLELKFPEYIVITFHDFLEFEYRFFGLDFGVGIYGWVQNNYFLFKQIGSDPVKDKSFGIQIFKRKPRKETQAHPRSSG